ncbi:MAG: COX15/CtaA family protein [Terriglobia bacterium]
MNENGGKHGESRFAAYAWLVLAYTILVILWGTVVRATGSGAGCGDHWPLCGGQVFPHAAQVATLIEFAHRLTSAVAIVLMLGLVWFAFRRFETGHPARRYSAAALFFTFMEGFIGAALVLLGDVGTNVSLSRVCVLSLHLVNTFLLLASLALTAVSASSGWFALPENPTEGRKAPSRRLILAYAAGLLGTLGIAVTGTLAALADALFHATSLGQAFRWDLSPSASPLLRLRIIHPAVAVMVGTFLLILAVHPLIAPAPAMAKRIAPCLLFLVLLQFCLGGLNVVLLAPLWLQVVHLLTADLVWISLVLLSAVMMGLALTRRSSESVHVAEGAAFTEHVVS